MENNRRLLYIYPFMPSIIYLMSNGIRILDTYEDTITAITRGDSVIHTTQLIFMDWRYIRGGYNIIIVEEEGQHIYNEESADFFIKQYGYDAPYIMLDLWKLGMLYND